MHHDHSGASKTVAQVIHNKPKNQRLAPVVGSSLRSDHIAVQAMSVVQFTRGNVSITLSSEGLTQGHEEDARARVLMLDTFVKLGPDVVRRSLRVWTPTDERTYFLNVPHLPADAIASDIQKLTHMMISVGAYPGGGGRLVPGDEAVSMEASFRAVQRLGLFRGEGTAWYITLEGLRRVRSSQRWVDPKPGIARRPPEALASYSMWELIDALLTDKGFEYLPMPIGRRGPGNAAIMPDPLLVKDVLATTAPRVFYFDPRTFQVKRDYLVCLLSMEHLSALGVEVISGPPDVGWAGPGRVLVFESWEV
jgi:hypothetical protein